MGKDFIMEMPVSLRFFNLILDLLTFHEKTSHMRRPKMRGK